MPLELAEARMALGLSLRTFGDVTGARARAGTGARDVACASGRRTRRDAIDRELAELVEGPARLPTPPRFRTSSSRSGGGRTPSFAC